MKIDELKTIIKNLILVETRTVTHTANIINKMGKEISDIRVLDIRGILNGTAGLIRYEKDGNAYEVIVRPAEYSEHKDLWKDRIEKKKKSVVSPKI